MKKVSYLFVLFCSVILMAGCSKLLEEPNAKYSYKAPVSLSDGLENSTLEEEGMNTAKMEHLTDLVNTDHYKNIHSIVIVKNNKLVYENYFNGYDQDMLHNMFSVSKSFTSCLAGIAIDKGWIPDTNAHLHTYFPEWPFLREDSSGKKDIQLQHLLTMTSGLACNDDDPSSLGGPEHLNQQKNRLEYFLQLPMTAEPGTKAQYCSGAIITLNHILAKSANRTFEDIARTFVFEPLGITKYKMNYIKNSVDPDMVFLRPRDMIKFGMLYLNDGKWKNQQIVSDKWVKTSFQTKVKLRNKNYGFLWWIHEGTFRGQEMKVYAASGNGGQFIFIVPLLKMVVAITAGNIDSPYSGQGFTILYNHIFDAVN